MGRSCPPGQNLRLRLLPVRKDGDEMEGAVMFEVASELALGALCGIGFVAWIARDVTASILAHVAAGHSQAS